jgi:hypothetical protein
VFEPGSPLTENFHFPCVPGNEQPTGIDVPAEVVPDLIRIADVRVRGSDDAEVKLVAQASIWPERTLLAVSLPPYHDWYLPSLQQRKEERFAAVPDGVPK